MSSSAPPSGLQIAVESAVNLLGYTAQITLLKLFLLKYKFEHPLWLTFLDQTVAFVLILLLTHVFRLMPDPEVWQDLVVAGAGGSGNKSRRADGEASADADHSPDPVDEEESTFLEYGKQAPKDEDKEDPDTASHVSIPSKSNTKTYAFWSEILPLGLLNVFSGATHYASHLFLFPSFVEMIQMTQTVPQVFVSVFVQGRDVSQNAIWSALPITVGGVLCAYGEVNFHVLGILLALGAVFFGVTRRAFAETLMTREDNYNAAALAASSSSATSRSASVAMKMVSSSPPTQTMQEGLATSWGMAYRLTPINILGLLFLSLVIEGSGPWKELEKKVLRTDEGAGLLLLKGVATSFWYVSEFVLVHHAGAFFMSVQYNLNRVVVIISTLLLFKNPIAAIQLVGLPLTVAGVSLYIIDKMVWQKGQTIFFSPQEEGENDSDERTAKNIFRDEEENAGNRVEDAETKRLLDEGKNR